MLQSEVSLLPFKHCPHKYRCMQSHKDSSKQNSSVAQTHPPSTLYLCLTVEIQDYLEHLHRMKQSSLSALLTKLVGIAANGLLLRHSMSISEDLIAKEREDPNKPPPDMLPHARAAVRIGALMFLNGNVSRHPTAPAGCNWFYVRVGDYHVYP